MQSSREVRSITGVLGSSRPLAYVGVVIVGDQIVYQLI